MADLDNEFSQTLQLHDPPMSPIEKEEDQAPEITEEAAPKDNGAANKTSRGSKRRKAPISAQQEQPNKKQKSSLTTIPATESPLESQEEAAAPVVAAPEVAAAPEAAVQIQKPTIPAIYEPKHLSATLKKYWDLCQEESSPEVAAEIQRILPTANRLRAALVKKIEKLKAFQLKASATKTRDTKARAPEKSARKPRILGKTKKETSAPEPASPLSPPQTSGSDRSVSPEQKQHEAEPQQKPATAPTAVFAEPTPAATSNQALTPDSAPKKTPSEPVITAAKKRGRPRKAATVTPEQKLDEPEAQQQQPAASTAAVADPTPAAAAATTKVATTASGPKKASSKPATAPKKRGRPRKET